MERCSSHPGGNHPLRLARSALSTPARHPGARCFTVLLALIAVSAHDARADRVPTASANAELVALAGALEYAASPQLGLHERQTGEASIRSQSLTYLTQKFAHMMVREAWKSMRERNEQEPLGTRHRIISNYDLRVSEDKLLVRMRYRF